MSPPLRLILVLVLEPHSRRSLTDLVRISGPCELPRLPFAFHAIKSPITPEIQSPLLLRGMVTSSPIVRSAPVVAIMATLRNLQRGKAIEKITRVPWIWKNVMQVHAVDAAERVVVRKAIARERIVI